jgi:hypothetical protein
MTWIVTYIKKAVKQYNNLSPVVQDRLDLLTVEMELLGPVRHNWKNYTQSWKAENESTIVTSRLGNRHTLLYGKKLTTQ